MLYSSDGMLGLAGLKGLIENGTYLHNPNIGAPGGFVGYDFFSLDADNVQWAILWVLARFTDSPGLLQTAYYLLGFPLAAGVTYVSLRFLGISRSVGAVSGIVYALIPYHFLRGTGHLFLSGYFALPAAGFLVIRLLQGQPLFRRAIGRSGPRAWLTPLSIWSVVAIVLAGGTTLYYAVFALMLLTIAAVVRVVQQQSLKAGFSAIVMTVVVGAVLVINVSPGLVYRWHNGPNEAVATRIPLESQIYATTLTDLVLPIQGHRIPVFNKVSREYQSLGNTPGEGGGRIGGLLAISLLGLVLWMLGAAIGQRGPPASATEEAERGLLGAASIGALSTVLIGTFGGLSMLVALTLTPQIRAWGRIAPFVAFFALVGFAVAAEKTLRRLRADRRHGAIIGPVLLGVVLVLAILDMTPANRAWRPPYEARLVEWQNDSRFVAAVEQRIPSGAMVVQLPFHPFPEEWGQFQMADYDHFRGYIHSHKGTRWSYGAMKGRSEDWTTPARSRSLRSMLKSAAIVGFDGVYLDRWGYEDYGRAIEGDLRKILGGGPTVVSDNGRLSFFPAAAYKRRVLATTAPAVREQIARDLLDPVHVTLYDHLIVPSPNSPLRVMQGPSAALEINNPQSAKRPMVLRASANGVPGGRLRVRVPGQAVRTFSGPWPAEVRIPFDAPAGDSSITISQIAGTQEAAPSTFDGLRIVPRLARD